MAVADKRITELESELARREAETQLSPSGVELRIQTLEEELTKRGEVVEPPIEDIPEEQFMVDEQIMSLAGDSNMAFADPNDLQEFHSQFKDNSAIIEKDIGIDRHGFIDTFKELKDFDKVAKRIPFAGSVYKIGRTLMLMDAVRIINTGNIVTPSNFRGGFLHPETSVPATEEDKKRSLVLIEKWMADLEIAQNRTTGGKFANALLEMPSFIVEFLVTGPIFKTSSKAAQTTALKLLGKMADSSTKKLAIRAAGAGFGSLVRTGVNVPKVLSGAIARMTTGLQITDDGVAVFADAERNPFTALTKSFTDLFIENISEIAGGAIGEGFSFAGKGIAKKFPFLAKATKELAEKWITNAPPGTVRTVQGFLTKATTKIGFNGILGEFAEERLADIMKAATGLQNWEDIIISKEDALIEVGVISVFGGINLASQKIFRGDTPTAEPIREKDILRPEQGEPLTPESLQKEELISLFDSAKNIALAKEQNKEALKFIDEQTAKPSRVGLDKILIPDQERDAKILNVATKSLALEGNAKTPPIVEPSGPIKRAIVRNIARAEDAVGTWGKTGLKVQKDLREIAFRTAVNVGNTTQNIKPLTKGLTKAEKVTVAKLIDEAISKEGQPNRLIERARLIKKELDVIQNEAIDLGLRTGGLTGKAFPQVLTKEGQAFLEEAERDGPKSSKVFAWAQNQVTAGKFKTVEDAIIGLQRYREGLISGKIGYIEGSRTLEIGNEFRDWNLDKILSNTIESSWEKIEAARQWGVLKDRKDDAGEMLLPFKDIQIDIAKIRADVGKNEATALNEYLKAQYGLSKADTALVKISRAARTTQFVGKLAFSPLTISRNILDRYAKGLSHGTFFTNARATIKYPPFLNHWIESARNIEEQMIRSGAVLGHGHLSEGFVGTEGALSFIARPFASSERGNQTYIALVKKLQLESDFKRLMELEGRDGTASKIFDRLAVIVGDSQQQITKRVLTDLSNEQLADAFSKSEISDDVMSEVLHRTVTDSAFPLTLASKRLWWNQRPVIQAATQFKVWSADQTRFIYKDILKYGIETGDYSRLARFMVATWMVGEMYNIARDELLNKDESVLSKIKGGTKTEIMMAVGKDLMDGGVVGIIADFTYGIGDWAAGPTVNSLTGVATAIDQARGTATIPEAIGAFLLEDIPALRQAQGVIDNLDSIFDENNLTENYARWQGRSFDFRRKQGESVGDIIGNRFMRSLRGTPQKRVTDRSLSLNMIARQVLVGDYSDAAQHIKRVVRQTDIQDLDSTIQSFNQSMKNNSPFGNIADKDFLFFITQFDKDEAVKGIKLQQQWLTGYKKSLKMAFDELEIKGFKEDLKDKAVAYLKKMLPLIEEAQAKWKEIEAELN